MYICDCYYIYGKIKEIKIIIIETRIARDPYSKSKGMYLYIYMAFGLSHLGKFEKGKGEKEKKRKNNIRVHIIKVDYRQWRMR